PVTVLDTKAYCHGVRPGPNDGGPSKVRRLAHSAERSNPPTVCPTKCAHNFLSFLHLVCLTKETNVMISQKVFNIAPGGLLAATPAGTRCKLVTALIVAA